MVNVYMIFGKTRWSSLVTWIDHRSTQRKKKSWEVRFYRENFFIGKKKILSYNFTRARKIVFFFFLHKDIMKSNIETNEQPGNHSSWNIFLCLTSLMNNGLFFAKFCFSFVTSLFFVGEFKVIHSFTYL